MHGAGCKGGNKIYGGAGRCHSHTAHPHRNKVRGGAEKNPTAATVHRAEVRKESFSWFVQRSSLLLHSRSDRLPLQIRDCMLMMMMMMVRWSHKGVVLLLLLKGAQTKKMSVLRPFYRGVSGNGVTFARRVSSTLVGLLTICFTAETSRLSGAARAPCLHQSRRDGAVWIAFVVTRCTLQRQEPDVISCPHRVALPLVHRQGMFSLEDKRRCGLRSGTEIWDDYFFSCSISLETARRSNARVSPQHQHQLWLFMCVFVLLYGWTLSSSLRSRKTMSADAQWTVLTQ